MAQVFPQVANMIPAVRVLANGAIESRHWLNAATKKLKGKWLIELLVRLQNRDSMSSNSSRPLSIPLPELESLDMHNDSADGIELEESAGLGLDSAWQPQGYAPPSMQPMVQMQPSESTSKTMRRPLPQIKTHRRSLSGSGSFSKLSPLGMSPSGMSLSRISQHLGTDGRPLPMPPGTSPDDIEATEEQTTDKDLDDKSQFVESPRKEIQEHPVTLQERYVHSRRPPLPQTPRQEEGVNVGLETPQTSPIKVSRGEGRTPLLERRVRPSLDGSLRTPSTKSSEGKYVDPGSPMGGPFSPGSWAPAVSRRGTGRVSWEPEQSNQSLQSPSTNGTLDGFGPVYDEDEEMAVDDVGRYVRGGDLYMEGDDLYARDDDLYVDLPPQPPQRRREWHWTTFLSGGDEYDDGVEEAGVSQDMTQPPMGDIRRTLYNEKTADTGLDYMDARDVNYLGNNSLPTSLRSSMRSSMRSSLRYTLGDSLQDQSSIDKAITHEGMDPNFTGYNMHDWSNRKQMIDDGLHGVGYHKKSLKGILAYPFTLRGLFNILGAGIPLLGCIFVFAGYPIMDHFRRLHPSNLGGYNLGGINGSGQVPNIGIRSLIDSDTPQDKYVHISPVTKEEYNLVFSDEFNEDGRTFWPGDDPFWQAVDLNYAATHDKEWYDPDAVTTENGALKITVTQEPWRGTSFRSAMLQSWNQFCFTGGYVEVALVLPAHWNNSGYWPGAWTMGNLGRAGYQGTTDGMWPYSYDSCDTGILPNQTFVNGTGPAGAEGLSMLSGQRISSCNCPGTDHPGPNMQTARGAPEIDILEAQYRYDNKKGQDWPSVSQSVQFAPFDYSYQPDDDYIWIADSNVSHINNYKGGSVQQAVSGVTDTPLSAFDLDGHDYAVYGAEYEPGKNGRVAWIADDKLAWSMDYRAVRANKSLDIGDRIIPDEPMYIILNLGIASNFEPIIYDELIFPAHMYVDYVRVYQKDSERNVGCSPPERPTHDYIQNHLKVYDNYNVTQFEKAGYKFPANKITGC